MQSTLVGLTCLLRRGAAIKPAFRIASSPARYWRGGIRLFGGMIRFRLAAMAGALSVMTLFILTPSAAASQQVIRLEKFAPCKSCELQFEPVARLNDTGNLINDRDAWAIYDAASRQYVLVSGPQSLAIYDGSGRYLKSVERRGGGPGEFNTIRHVVPTRERSLVVLDVGLGRWMVLDSTLAPLAHAVVGGVAGPFFVLGLDSAVVAGVGTSTSNVVFPLRLEAFSTGRVLRHFGSRSADFNVARPWAHQVLLAKGEQLGAVWIARPNELRLEEWTLQNDLIRVIAGDLAWFPRVDRIPAPGREAPPTRLKQFEFDGHGRLWLLSSVPSDGWRNAVETVAPDGEVIIDPSRYFFTRVDIYDLKGTQHLGSLTWADHAVRLMKRDQDVMLQRVEIDERDNVALVLYRLKLLTQGGLR